MDSIDKNSESNPTISKEEMDHANRLKSQQVQRMDKEKKNTSSVANISQPLASPTGGKVIMTPHQKGADNKLSQGDGNSSIEQGARVDIRGVLEEHTEISTARQKQYEVSAKGKKDAENEKQLSDKVHKWKKDQIMQGKKGELDFDKEVFSVLAGTSPDTVWFQFESRVRQIIVDLMQPLQYKQQDVTDKMKDQKTDFFMLKRRLDELDFVFQKVQRQSNSFDDVKNDQDRFKNEVQTRVMNFRNELQINIQRINDQDESVRQADKQVSNCLAQIEDLKKSFFQTVRETQDINEASQKLSITIKEDCFAMMSRFAQKLDEIERMKLDIERIKLNVDEDLKKLGTNVEINKSNMARLEDDLNTRFTKFNVKYDTGVRRLDKDMSFLKTYTQTFENDYRQLEFYINQIQPIREFSSMCNVLHRVLRNKDEYNNLVEYEQRVYQNILEKFGIKIGEANKKRYKIEIPQKPCLSEVRKRVILPTISDPEKASAILEPTFVDKFRDKLENNEFDPDPTIEMDWGGDKLKEKAKPKKGEQSAQMIDVVKQNLLKQLENQMKRYLSNLEDAKYRPQSRNIDGLVDKLFLNTFDHTMKMYKEKRARMYIVSDVLFDVKHIAQANLETNSTLVQQYEIEGLLREKEKKQELLLTQKEMLKQNIKVHMANMSSVQGSAVKGKKQQNSKAKKMEAKMSMQMPVGADESDNSHRQSSSRNSSRPKTKSTKKQKTRTADSPQMKSSQGMKERSQEQVNISISRTQQPDDLQIGSIKEDLGENMVTLGAESKKSSSQAKRSPQVADKPAGKTKSGKVSEIQVNARAPSGVNKVYAEEKASARGEAADGFPTLDKSSQSRSSRQPDQFKSSPRANAKNRSVVLSKQSTQRNSQTNGQQPPPQQSPQHENLKSQSSASQVVETGNNFVIKNSTQIFSSFDKMASNDGDKKTSEVQSGRQPDKKKAAQQVQFEMNSPASSGDMQTGGNIPPKDSGKINIEESMQESSKAKSSRTSQRQQQSKTQSSKQSKTSRDAEADDEEDEQSNQEAKESVDGNSDDKEENEEEGESREEEDDDDDGEGDSENEGEGEEDAVGEDEMDGEDYGQEGEESEGEGISEKALNLAIDGVRRQMREECKEIANKNAAVVFEIRIKELAKTVHQFKDITFPKINDKLADLYGKLDGQNVGFVEEVQKLKKETIEVFHLLEVAHNKALRERSDLQTQFESIHDEIQELRNYNYESSKHISHMTKLQEMIFKQQEIQFKLDYQDEKDRENVALLGMSKNKDTVVNSAVMSQGGRQDSPEGLKREVTAAHIDEENVIANTSNGPKGVADDLQPNNQSIQLKNNCVSCSGQINFIKKTFKMACLAYKPSKILVQNVVFSRKDLLARREELLRKQKQLLDNLIRKQMSQSPQGGHTTLEDTDVAITLDTNNFYPHAMVPSANLSSIINETVNPAHMSQSPRIGGMRAHARVKHSGDSPKAATGNPLLIESMDSRNMQDMTARRRSQVASRLLNMEKDFDGRDKNAGSPGIDRIISQELNINIDKPNTRHHDGPSSPHHSPGSRNSTTNVRAISSLSTNKKMDSPLRESKFQNYPSKANMDRRNMMNKSSVFGESNQRTNILTSNLPDINKQLNTTKSMSRTQGKFVFSSQAMSGAMSGISSDQKGVSNGNGSQKRDPVQNARAQMGFSSLGNANIKENPNMDSKFQLRNSLQTSHRKTKGERNMQLQDQDILIQNSPSKKLQLQNQLRITDLKTHALTGGNITNSDITHLIKEKERAQGMRDSSSNKRPLNLYNQIFPQTPTPAGTTGNTKGIPDPQNLPTVEAIQADNGHNRAKSGLFKQFQRLDKGLPSRYGPGAGPTAGSGAGSPQSKMHQQTTQFGTESKPQNVIREIQVMTSKR